MQYLASHETLLHAFTYALLHSKQVTTSNIFSIRVWNSPFILYGQLPNFYPSPCTWRHHASRPLIFNTHTHKHTHTHRHKLNIKYYWRTSPFDDAMCLVSIYYNAGNCFQVHEWWRRIGGAHKQRVGGTWYVNDVYIGSANVLLPHTLECVTHLVCLLWSHRGKGH